jgi:hypothetical protein
MKQINRIYWVRFLIINKWKLNPLLYVYESGGAAMKKILFAVSMTIILASCQKESAAPVLYDPPASNMENGLIDFEEWEGFHLSKPGSDSRLNEDDALMIQAIQEVFSGAVKVEGMANLEDPDFIMGGC